MVEEIGLVWLDHKVQCQQIESQPERFRAQNWKYHGPTYRPKRAHPRFCLGNSSSESCETRKGTRQLPRKACDRSIAIEVVSVIFEQLVLSAGFE